MKKTAFLAIVAITLALCACDNKKTYSAPKMSTRESSTSTAPEAETELQEDENIKKLPLTDLSTGKDALNGHIDLLYLSTSDESIFVQDDKGDLYALIYDSIEDGYNYYLIAESANLDSIGYAFFSTSFSDDGSFLARVYSNNGQIILHSKDGTVERIQAEGIDTECKVASVSGSGNVVYFRKQGNAVVVKDHTIFMTGGENVYADFEAENIEYCSDTCFLMNGELYDLYASIVQQPLGNIYSPKKADISDDKYTKLFSGLYRQYETFAIDELGKIYRIDTSLSEIEKITEIAENSGSEIINIFGQTVGDYDDGIILQKEDGYYTLEEGKLILNEKITGFAPESIYYCPTGFFDGEYKTLSWGMLKNGTLYSLDLFSN